MPSHVNYSGRNHTERHLSLNGITLAAVTHTHTHLSAMRGSASARLTCAREIQLFLFVLVGIEI